MKRLIISVLMLLGATLIFSQGNKHKDVNAQQQDAVKKEVKLPELS
ncbi:MAG TPA: hypothetical protein VKZ97_00035 [Flavobacteriaceae bacterium]|nr:hypothetical protein [Flavobacteriaceae bacterium]